MPQDRPDLAPRARELLVVVFDLDGTLVDSMTRHAYVFATLLAEEFGISLSEALRHYRRTAGQPLTAQIREALPAAAPLEKEQIESLASRFTAAVRETRPVLFPDVPAAIQQLMASGFRLAITSGGPPTLVEVKLRLTGLDNCFEIALGTDTNRQDMTKGTGHFRLIRKHFHLSSADFRRQAAMVGDTPYDMRIAKRGGLLAIGRRGWYETEELVHAGADIVIENLTEVVGQLKVWAGQ